MVDAASACGRTPRDTRDAFRCRRLFFGRTLLPPKGGPTYVCESVERKKVARNSLQKAQRELWEKAHIERKRSLAVATVDRSTARRVNVVFTDCSSCATSFLSRHLKESHAVFLSARRGKKKRVAVVVVGPKRWSLQGALFCADRRLSEKKTQYVFHVCRALRDKTAKTQCEKRKKKKSGSWRPKKNVFVVWGSRKKGTDERMVVTRPCPPHMAAGRNEWAASTMRAHACHMHRWQTQKYGRRRQQQRRATASIRLRQRCGREPAQRPGGQTTAGERRRVDGARRVSSRRARCESRPTTRSMCARQARQCRPRLQRSKVR